MTENNFEEEIWGFLSKLTGKDNPYIKNNKDRRKSNPYIKNDKDRRKIINILRNLFKKHEEEKRILQQNIMQAVSHTLGNMLFVQKAITNNLLNSANLDDDVKRLQLFQTVTASVLDSIKVAFGGNIENNIEFFSKNGKNRISLISTFYFALSINMDNLLQAAGYWEKIYDNFFCLTEENEDKIIEITENIQKNDDFKVIELSDDDIKRFINFFHSPSGYLLNDKFKINSQAVKDIFFEKDGYTFSIIFTIFQELIKNMFKYGLIDISNKFIINSKEDNEFYTIYFENNVKIEEKNRIGTLRGLEMIKLFSNILGEFKKEIKDDKFSITIRIKKVLIDKDDNENIMGWR